METKMIEAMNGTPAHRENHGKFLLARFTLEEWIIPSKVAAEARPGTAISLLQVCGWTPKHLWVFDLQTGEGALFLHGGLAEADLAKHQIWHCPLYPSFLAWLYTQDVSNFSALPDVVELPEAPFALRGKRSPGRGRR